MTKVQLLLRKKTVSSRFLLGTNGAMPWCAWIWQRHAKRIGNEALVESRLQRLEHRRIFVSLSVTFRRVCDGIVQFNSTKPVPPSDNQTTVCLVILILLLVIYRYIDHHRYTVYNWTYTTYTDKMFWECFYWCALSIIYYSYIIIYS